MSSDEFEWELNRENIQPIRRGRHAAALSHAGPALMSSRKAVVEEKMNEVLQSFTDDEAAGDSDPLATVITFLSWLDDELVSVKQKVVYEFLWKCVNKLLTIERYTEDERMLKVWMRLAETSLGNEYKIYDYANSAGSLTRCARLYVEWSLSCEGRGMADEARRCLDRAIRSGALPNSLIREAQDQLEMRILRRATQMDDSDNDFDEDIVNENEEVRSAFTRLAPLEEGVTPIVRIASISGHEGSSKLPISAQKPKKNATFQIFADVEEERNWLEDIYEMKTHLGRPDLNDDNTGTTTKQTLLGCSKGTATASFTIWEEGKEEVKPKARLMIAKRFIKDSSVEEGRVERFAILFETISPVQENRPKNLHLCKADIKPLCFD